MKITNVAYSLIFDHKVSSLETQDAEYYEIGLRMPSNRQRMVSDKYYMAAKTLNNEHGETISKGGNPFRDLLRLFASKDLIFINLETPLTRARRQYGMFKSDPRFADVLKQAGIGIVSIANNHVFDAGEDGFLETLEVLETAGIAWTGGGSTLEEARRGNIVDVRGVRVKFLGYTQFCNTRFASAASDSYPGIAPLDAKEVEKDIKFAKGESDLVFLSLHWGVENQPNILPRQREIGRRLIEVGADAIIGHHTHVPHGIEVYRNRPIVYSLGNLIFGHSRREWSDNILAEIVIEDGAVKGLLVYPIGGIDGDLLQPSLVEGERANKLLEEIRVKSAILGTGMLIKGNVGYVAVA